MVQLRQLLAEVRKSLPEGTKVGQLPLTRYILEQYRRNAVTAKQYCRAEEDAANVADSFASYLRAQRQWLQVHQEYHAKGERSVEDTAKIVGFKLPHDPK